MTDHNKNYDATFCGRLPIQPDRGDYLIAFRPELLKTISWGANRMRPYSLSLIQRYTIPVQHTLNRLN